MNKETMFTNMEDDQFVELLGSIQVLTGMKPTSNVQNNPGHARYFIDQLKKRFPKTTYREAETAFEIVASGAVDKFTTKTLTIQSISNVLRTHLNNANTNGRYADDDVPQLTKEEKQEVVIRGMHAEFSRFKSCGMIFNFGNSTHNYLEKWGLLGFTDDEMKSIVKKAEKTYIRSIGSKKTSQNATKINDTIAEFIGGGGVHSAYTKHLGTEKVKVFFKSLKDVDMDLIDVLVQKKIITEQQAAAWGCVIRRF